MEKGRVFVNGAQAQLGDKVLESDTVEVRFRQKKYRYFAYNKPRGVITHSPQGDEESIEDIFPIKGVFPIGRLDKDSYGLIILTDDGRITDLLLNPKYEHEKEYEVVCLEDLPKDFKRQMERGVDIGDHTTRPCCVEMLGKRKFAITLTEGKKHQIRRMCGAFGQSVVKLKRVRVMNIRLAGVRPGEYRSIEGAELSTFLKSIGM